jgi:hypothetical protein
VLATTITRGGIQENHAAELEEGSRVAWIPAEPGQGRPDILRYRRLAEQAYPGGP